MAYNHILRIIQPGFAELMMIQNGHSVQDVQDDTEN